MFQRRRSIVDPTFSCAVDFELTNEIDSIKISPNTSNSNNAIITHVKPAESCLKYSIVWKNKEIFFAKNYDRFGQFKIIPHQRIGIIGVVEQNVKGEWQIGGIPKKNTWLPCLNIDVLNGLLIIVRESERDCKRRLYGQNNETLPHYTFMELDQLPPDYNGENIIDRDIGISAQVKSFKLPLSAQSSLIRKLSPFYESPNILQEIVSLIFIVIVVSVFLLSFLLESHLNVAWYGSFAVFRFYVGLISIYMDLCHFKELFDIGAS